jgi:hypothetical protein|tara:strand:+ start:1086 stop:1529 length:444 start_codon:yes stop_codon:yes gene_type:complete
MARFQEQRDKMNVLVGYKENLPNSHSSFIPLNADNREYKKCLEWIGQGNTPDSDPDVLTTSREEKKGEYIEEAVRRIALRVPEWDSYKDIRRVAVTWGQMINPTADQIAAKDIYVYIKNTAFANVDVQATPELVNAIDVVNDPNFPS